MPTTLILSTNSNTWTVPAGSGSQVNVFGSSAYETVKVEAGANVAFKAFGANDTLQVLGSAADYTVHSAGATVYLTHKDGGTIELAAGLSPTSLSFSDGDADLSIVPGSGIMLGDQAITSQAAPLDAIIPPVTTLSADQGTADSQVALTLEDGAHILTDDASVMGNIQVNNFTDDDLIIASNAIASDYAFSNDGEDVSIIYNNNGTVNNITLLGVVSSSDLVYDEASMEVAMGFDAFQIA